MGYVVRNNQDRNTELNDRINADLRMRAEMKSGMTDPDLVEDSDYVKDTAKTGRFGWVWIVLIVLAIVSLITIAVI